MILSAVSGIGNLSSLAAALLVVFLLQEGVEGAQAADPLSAMVFDPLGGGVERLGVQRQDVLAAAHFAADEARTLEEPDVLRHRVQRNRKRLCEIGDARFAARELLENCASRRIRERDQRVIERRCRARQRSPFRVNVVHAASEVQARARDA
jgi:hypothetical protein